MSIDVKQEVIELKEELVAVRRDFHMHPELAFEEHRTAKILADRLKKLGFQVQTGVAKTGVVGILECGQPGKTLMLRADMDALPIQEIEGRTYGSTYPGKMHACGHDGHTAVSLVIADILAKHKNQLKGRVKIVFQPAEEIVAGGKLMLEEGVMENPTPDRIIGFHTFPSLPRGKIGVRDGAMWAGVEELCIAVKGTGGHGGTPHVTADPIVAGSNIILSLENILARELSPFNPAALTMGVFSAGTRFNVIPDSIEIRGSSRTFTEETREFVRRRVEEISQLIAQAYRCSAKVSVERSAPAVWNNAEVANAVREAAAKVVGPDNVVDPGQSTVGDDVSVFLNEAPGCYFLLGVGNAEKGAGAPLHSPEYDLDEDALPIALETMSRAAIDFLS